MNSESAVIEIRDLKRRYGKVEAVNGLNLTVRAGRCYGFFGRNGAGKTTTIKCLLNLLRPQAGSVRVFGLDPRTNEVAVKSRLTYVPDAVAFYPWMTVRDTLDYFASFRARWNRGIEADLLRRFGLAAAQKASDLSRGQKTQLALIAAICQRTVFVSTHLISEFEGLIDEFTIIEQGRELLTMAADAARDRFRKIRARFAQPLGTIELPGALSVKRNGREIEVLANGSSEELIAKLKAQQPEDLQMEALTLEEIFVASQTLGQSKS